MTDAKAMMNAIQALASSQKDLQDTIAAITQNSVKSTKPLSKPQLYDGQRGDDTRRFMAAFKLWANGNVVAQTPPNKKPIIESALTFLEKDAVVWATPYTEAINNAKWPNLTAKYPWADWDEFEAV